MDFIKLNVLIYEFMLNWGGGIFGRFFFGFSCDLFNSFISDLSKE